MSLRIDGRTRLAGILGYPVEHSLSPAMHNAAFLALGLNCAYVPLSVHPEQLGAAVAGLAPLGFIGANVTIPHKEAVTACLDEISAEALAIGAVNTIVIRDERLSGYNTDAVGFMAPLSDLGLRAADLHALVLGAGGAARAVVYGLARAGAAVTIVNRNPDRAASLVDVLREHLPAARLASGPLTPEGIGAVLQDVDLVVNTTALGMTPHENASPWPNGVPFPRRAVAYELIYTPAETRWLAMARSAGARTLNGLPMLVQQGAESFTLWTGQPAPVSIMLEAVSNGRRA